MIITDSANTEVAQEWIKYAVGDGYVQTLSIAPEGKFPVRRGDASDSDKFVQAWSSLPVRSKNHLKIYMMHQSLMTLLQD